MVQATMKQQRSLDDYILSVIWIVGIMINFFVLNAQLNHIIWFFSLIVTFACIAFLAQRSLATKSEAPLLFTLLFMVWGVSQVLPIIAFII